MSLLERIKGLFINKNIQKEHNNNLEENSEYYDIYHENEEIQILGEISKLASEIKTAFFAIQPDEQDILEYTKALEDSTKILENGLLMMRKDLSSTTAEEITQEELLLYERRRYDGEYWNRICSNSRPTCNRW